MAPSGSSVPAASTSADASTAIARRSKSAAWWALIAVLILEFFLFDHFGSKRVTGFYPRWNDQIQYLSEAYTGYEYAREHGFAAGLWHTLVNPSAQGTLHDFAALMVFEFTGPSRSAALALNMLALIAWQLALFLAVDRRLGQRALALGAAMLPLVLRGPWQDVPGSAYDFRLDHLAMCAIGVTAVLAVMADGFRNRRWSVAFGVVVGVTLLTRFLTGTYFVVIFVALALWIIFHRERRKRLANLTLAAFVAAAMAAPIFWLNREWVWNYYVIGHYVGPESAIRNQNFGLQKSFAFVWGWLGERHLGAFFGWFAGAIAVALIALRLIDRRRGEADTRTHRRGLWIIGAIFLLAPTIVLVLHPQKSEVVLGALVPGVITLVIALWTSLAGSMSLRQRHFAVAQGVVAAASVLVALVYFGRCQRGVFEDPAIVANRRQVNTVADFVLREAQMAHLAPIRVSVDNITDALDAQVLRVVCYERHRVWKDWDMKLPTGITEPEAADVRQRIQDSDFVFLYLDDPTPGPFPYDRKLAQMRPELRAWCESHLKRAKVFVLLGRAVVLYQRREIPLVSSP